MSGVKLLVNSAFGIYIPQFFFKTCDYSQWTEIDTDDMMCVNDGVDNEHYWDCWDNIIANAKMIDEHGNTWRLYQDGDLYAYCFELMTEEEREAFEMTT